MRLHKKSRVIIDKWLYVENRYPDFQAVYELYKLIVALRGTVPTELRRIVQRSNNRVADFIDSLNGENIMGDDAVLGERKQAGRKSACYYEFKGELLSVRQISEILGCSSDNVYTRIRRRGVDSVHGANVDFLEKNRQKRA